MILNEIAKEVIRYGIYVDDNHLPNYIRISILEYKNQYFEITQQKGEVLEIKISKIN